MKRLKSDRGITVVEMMVALTVVSVITAIVGGVFSSLLRQSHGQLALAQTQADTRLVVREMIIELRETVGPGANGINPVTKLGWDEIVFHADVAPSDGAADRIRYFLTCSAGFCDLFRQVTPPDDPTADPLTYTPANASTPEMILPHLIATLTEPLFLGIVWTPGTGESRVASCDDSSASPCELDLIQLTFAVRPLTTRVNPGTFEIYERVRLRNVN